MDWWQYIPPYAQWTVYDYAFHALWGLVGALVRLSYTNAPIRLPQRNKDGSIKLNALGEIFVSVSIGMLADTNPLISVSAAVAAPQIVEAVISLQNRGLRTALRHWLELNGVEDD